MKNTFFFSNLLFLILIQSFAFAGVITGTVYEYSSKEPLASGAIIIKNAGFSKTYPINLDGSYDASGLPNGSYMVIADCNGHRDTAMKINVSTDQIVPLDFYLNTLLAEVNVVGKVKGGYTPIINLYDNNIGIYIKAIDMKHAGVTKIKDIAELSPKVNVNENGDISIAGSRPTATRTMIDGVYTISDISLPVGSIKYMRVYSGGIPAKYGDCSGGVIVIETKSYFD
jgi:hypothetical protein